MTFAGSTASALEFRTFRVRGTNVAAIDVVRATDLIGQLATDAQGVYVTVTGAHGIVESVYEDRIREAHQHAYIAVPDGMPLCMHVDVLHESGPHRQIQRCHARLLL